MFKNENDPLFHKFRFHSCRFQKSIDANRLIPAENKYISAPGDIRRKQIITAICPHTVYHVPILLRNKAARTV